MSNALVLSRKAWSRTKRELPMQVSKRPRVRTDYKDTATFQELKKTYGDCIKEEHRFHAERKWRFDFAYINDAIGKRIAIEIEGGTWISGRHNHPTSIQKDMEKYNAAAMLGWCVLRYTPKQWRDGLPVSDMMRMVVN